MSGSALTCARFRCASSHRLADDSRAHNRFLVEHLIDFVGRRATPPNTQVFGGKHHRVRRRGACARRLRPAAALAARTTRVPTGDSLSSACGRSSCNGGRRPLDSPSCLGKQSAHENGRAFWHARPFQVVVRRRGDSRDASNDPRGDGATSPSRLSRTSATRTTPRGGRAIVGLPMSWPGTRPCPSSS
jgi:hypothetical protein